MDAWEIWLIRISVPLACALVSWGITELVNFIKSKINNKKLKNALDDFATQVEKIAETVENVFAGEDSVTKLSAFREICAKKSIDETAAVQYLEEHIIPTSKKINVVPVDSAKEDENDFAD